MTSESVEVIPWGCGRFFGPNAEEFPQIKQRILI